MFYKECQIIFYNASKNDQNIFSRYILRSLKRNDFSKRASSDINLDIPFNIMNILLFEAFLEEIKYRIFSMLWVILTVKCCDNCSRIQEKTSGYLYKVFHLNLFFEAEWKILNELRTFRSTYYKVGIKNVMERLSEILHDLNCKLKKISFKLCSSNNVT